MRTETTRDQKRFGIGEWYGSPLERLSAAESRRLAVYALGESRAGLPCRFQSTAERSVACGKAGGVCTLRMYVRSRATGDVLRAPGDEGRLRTVCPKRFDEDGLLRRWVGETLLGCHSPVIVREVGFLTGAVSDGDEVSRIDEVLVVPGEEPLKWCALEVQAVYFQGSAMAPDFRALAQWSGEGLPFPVGNRRPDYRSSGPKRLMPQLQVKVPSLRRWGKKMAVAVDTDFFAALAPMRGVEDVSNCDIAWFVVGYDESGGSPRLVPDRVHLTTLEQAVEGLTAGVPLSLEAFEERIRAKLARLGEQR
ncbi:MAG: hypothetical protein K6V36_11490 [Anaerolineae bacterium]|nr:hypothetical protein [Anaerolineae bacterium]